jgi:comEA protein
MLNRFKKLGLTKQDAVLVSFLLGVFLIGLVIKLSGWSSNQRSGFDYSANDREFEQRIKSAFTELKPAALSAAQENRLKEIELINDSLTRLKDVERTSDISSLKLDKKININLAYSADLQILPGIGEVTAERIIEYRERHGSFRKTEEIMNVRGIGQKKFDRIKDYIIVE